jgi:serine protease Do
MKDLNKPITGALAILAALTLTLSACAPATAQQPNTAAPPAGNDVVVVNEIGDLLANLYDRVNPAVVNIQVAQAVQVGGDLPDDHPSLPDLPGFPDLPELPNDQLQFGQGSGFVWDTEGHIVTNYHVVNQAERVNVTFSDGLTLEAKIVGTDPDSDLAVIQIDPLPEGIEPLKLAKSNALRVGESVVAIGNPFGLEGTMTTGIVSALGRSLPSQARTAEGGTFNIPNVIQTDAAINPGNSGGPLLDYEGHVIGINTAIESPVRQFSGVGYAVPSDIIAKIVPALIKDGSYSHPWLGIAGRTLTPGIREAMDLDKTQPGVLVISVVKDSPADDAGLQGSEKEVTIDGLQALVGGDIIVGIDGRDVREFDDLLSYLVESTVVGQDITLNILRNGKTIGMDITLGERPSTNL